MSEYSNKENNFIEKRKTQNKQIIERLRQKFRPLKEHKVILAKTQQQMFPHIPKSGSLHVSSTQPKFGSKRGSIYAIQLNAPSLIVFDEQHPLVKKANEVIWELRREPRNSDYERPIQKASLQKYLTMLDGSKKADNEQALKLNQQIEMLHQRQPYFLTQVQPDENKQKQEQFSFEESRLLNAKIRQRLNHKKIISLYR